jgi:hypothetical protein
MRGAIPPLPNTSSWHGEDDFTLPVLPQEYANEHHTPIETGKIELHVTNIIQLRHCRTDQSV